MVTSSEKLPVAARELLKSLIVTFVSVGMITGAAKLLTFEGVGQFVGIFDSKYPNIGLLELASREVAIADGKPRGTIWGKNNNETYLVYMGDASQDRIGQNRIGQKQPRVMVRCSQPNINFIEKQLTYYIIPESSSALPEVERTLDGTVALTLNRVHWQGFTDDRPTSDDQPTSGQKCKIALGPPKLKDDMAGKSAKSRESPFETVHVFSRREIASSFMAISWFILSLLVVISAAYVLYRQQLRRLQLCVDRPDEEAG